MKDILSETQFLKILLYLRRRRRRNKAFLYLAHALIFEYSTIYRSVWKKPRTQSFWIENVLNFWTNEDWIQNFRMYRETFTYICEEIREFIEKSNTNFRKAVTVEMRVAIALYFYSGTCDYRTISNLFGIGRSTVCNILHVVSKTIVKRLLPKIIRLPNEIEVQTIMREFEEISGFPQAVGAVDGCHIRIKAPLKDAEDYINRKDYHSIILQGFVDNSYLFRDIFVGWPGKSHDARIFKNSPLYQECLQRTFLPRTLSRDIQHTSIPPLILGDSAYPLEDLL